MKGGALFPESDIEKDAAISHFLSNCTYTTLTNSSVSCITLKCNINSGITSKLFSLNSSSVRTPLNTLLLKVMPSHPMCPQPPGYSILTKRTTNLRGPSKYPGVEINCYDVINREINIQKDIYRQTILSPTYFLDGLCPAILSSFVPCSIDVQNYFQKTILDSKLWR
jgi:hypothetical protein